MPILQGYETAFFVVLWSFIDALTHMYNYPILDIDRLYLLGTHFYLAELAN